ncbi:MAG: Holliday junction branch migration protein RuvA [Candidatus Peregrinibacteria bacterium]|nr:Holliday junction branch migration protein RuvA [Candidatus Peregrinibacteria bacterium]
MISHLRGTVHKLDPGEVSVDVAGVGYRVTVPVDVWDALREGEPNMVWVSTYVREDRLELFGFLDRAGRTLFEELIKQQGIGPRLGLELCAVPRSILLNTVNTQDPAALMSIKGIGKRTAEKLLLELKSLVEKKPDIFGSRETLPMRNEFDQDAIAALSQLGYDASTIMRALRELPATLTTTEERVAAALRGL